MYCSSKAKKCTPKFCADVWHEEGGQLAQYVRESDLWYGGHRAAAGIMNSH